MADIEMSPARASAALAGIDQSSAAVRDHSRWVRRALAAYGVATLLFFPAGGLLHGAAAVAVNTTWVVFLVAVACYVFPRRVVARGSRRRYLISAALWTVLWTAAAVLGHAAFPDNPAYWLSTAPLVALPMLLAAFRSNA
jgi:hypothetical protein